jgi:hypothetical protein
MLPSKPILDDREKAYEQELVHAEDLVFRTHAVRNRLLAEWAAARMQLGGEAAATYVSSIFEASSLRSDDAHLVEKIAGDIQATGSPVTDDEIWRVLRQFAKEAHRAVHESGR